MTALREDSGKQASAASNCRQKKQPDELVAEVERASEPEFFLFRQEKPVQPIRSEMLVMT